MGDSAGGDVDRISALPDDMVHVILASLRKAEDVTRTAVLSRRWRRAWIHSRGLSFDDKHVEQGTVPPDHLARFVDWALAQRGVADMESLRIDIFRQRGVSPEQINAWIRYATRRVVGSFYLHLPYGPPKPPPPVVELPVEGRAASIALRLPGHALHLPAAGDARYESLTELTLSVARFGEDDDGKPPAVELPGGEARTTSISLYLSRRRLLLPAAASASYPALTELTLGTVLFDEDDDGRALGDLVSSCCPRLRRLHIELPFGQLHQLVLRVEALQELRVRMARELRTLDVTAPNLRVLKLEFCFNGDAIDNVARVAAPGLQEIVLSTNSHNRVGLDIRGLSSVRRLGDLRLSMHGRYCRATDPGLRLLEGCPRAESVSVWLGHRRVDPDGNLDEFVDLAREGAAPFARVRSLYVYASGLPDRHIVASISSLLVRCPRLRSLRVKIVDTVRDIRSCDCICDGQYTWKDYGKIKLRSLEEVEIRGFTGADEEMDLVTLLFETSNSIKSMALNFSSSLALKDDADMSDVVSLEETGEEDEDSFLTIDQELENIPCTDRGHWHFGENIYTWKCYTAKNGQLAL